MRTCHYFPSGKFEVVITPHSLSQNAFLSKLVKEYTEWKRRIVLKHHFHSIMEYCRESQRISRLATTIQVNLDIARTCVMALLGLVVKRYPKKPVYRCLPSGVLGTFEWGCHYCEDQDWLALEFKFVSTRHALLPPQQGSAEMRLLQRSMEIHCLVPPTSVFVARTRFAEKFQGTVHQIDSLVYMLLRKCTGTASTVISSHVDRPLTSCVLPVLDFSVHVSMLQGTACSSDTAICRGPHRRPCEGLCV